MLPVLLGLLGTSSALYIFLRFYWPTLYMDWLYMRKGKELTNAALNIMMSGKTLADVFEDTVKQTPSKTFIIYKDQKFSYKFMDQKANQVARAMVEIGVRPGSVVAIMIFNEPAFIWTYIGLLKAGMQIALINFNLRNKSLAHCIKVSGANVFLVGQGDALVQAVTDIQPDLPGISVYLQGITPDQKPPSMMAFDTVMSRMSSNGVDRSLRKDINPLTTCLLMYTSGTTGLPKPAIVNHAKCIGAGFAFNFFDMTADDILYQPLPLYHGVGLLVGFHNVITHGATMVLKDKFSASHFWDDCRKHKVTVIQYIGELCRYLLAHPESKLDGQHSVRVAYGNGLRKDIWIQFKDRFNLPRIIEFYGATESPVGSVNLGSKVGACGRSSPLMRKGMPLAFIEYDNLSQSPVRNKEGLCIPTGTESVGLMIADLTSGQISFTGYKGKKEDSEKKVLHDVFRKGDRYFNTGDLMYMDKDYFIYFSDRTGDTFRWKGENVSTTEVSNTLTDLSFIHDANVYGVTVPGTEGRAGMASLSLIPAGTLDLAPAMLSQLSDHIRSALPSYARPRFIRVQSEFDMTSTFKQQKMQLVREGFDISKITDKVYYLNPPTQSYLPLDEMVYGQIMAGRVPL